MTTAATKLQSDPLLRQQFNKLTPELSSPAPEPKESDFSSLADYAGQIEKQDPGLADAIRAQHAQNVMPAMLEATRMVREQSEARLQRQGSRAGRAPSRRGAVREHSL